LSIESFWPDKIFILVTGSGVPLPAVSPRLSHGSILTTQEIYAHMILGQDDESAPALGRLPARERSFMSTDGVQ
jgi:hypothetical protein